MKSLSADAGMKVTVAISFFSGSADASPAAIAAPGVGFPGAARVGGGTLMAARGRAAEVGAGAGRERSGACEDPACGKDDGG
jgi:hypothetical protein